MERYLPTGRYGDDPHAVDIPDTLFWGALIFLALFVFCFLVWKALEGRGNRTTLDGVAMTEDPKAPPRPVTARSGNR